MSSCRHRLDDVLADVDARRALRSLRPALAAEGVRGGEAASTRRAEVGAPRRRGRRRGCRRRRRCSIAGAAAAVSASQRCLRRCCRCPQRLPHPRCHVVKGWRGRVRRRRRPRLEHVLQRHELGFALREERGDSRGVANAARVPELESRERARLLAVLLERGTSCGAKEGAVQRHGLPTPALSGRHDSLGDVRDNEYRSLTTQGWHSVVCTP